MRKEDRLIMIKNTPKIVDYMLDETVTVDSRIKLRKRLEEVCNLATQALEQDKLYYDFARWVATEIFDEMWEYNKDTFEELACRKLEKLGIVRAKDGEWQFIEPQESEEK